MGTEIGLTIAELLLIVVTAVAATGGGILVILPRLKNDPAFMAAVEKLGESVPADTAALLVELAKAVQTTGAIVEEALDGIPAESKTVTAGATGGATVTLETPASDTATLTADEVKQDAPH